MIAFQARPIQDNPVKNREIDRAFGVDMESSKPECPNWLHLGGHSREILMTIKEPEGRQLRRTTIGLVSGESKTGWMTDFNPAAEALRIAISVSAPGGARSDVAVEIPTDRVSYVAWDREGLATARKTDGPEFSAECTVFVPPGLSFSVLVDPQKLPQKPGFYAKPLSRCDRYGEFYFFRYGIIRCERAEPLGALLVQSGIAAAEVVESGLEAQRVAQNTRLGEILVENETIEADAVQTAVVQQHEQIRRGRTVRLGELLVEAGLVSAADVQSALEEQKQRRGQRLGEVLVSLGLIDEKSLATVLAEKFNLPFVDLDDETIEPEAFNEIPAQLTTRFRLFPFKSDEATITVAMSDPLALEALDMLRFSTPKRIKEVVVEPSQLEEYLTPYLLECVEVDNDESLDSIMLALAEEEGGIAERDVGDRAVVRLVDRIILSAYRRGASDIHIEPNGPQHSMVVRFRVDGDCFVFQHLPPEYRKAIVSRIKIISRLDIAERRRPQDGRIRLQYGKRQLDLRVVTMPNHKQDEDVVLRILPDEGAVPLDELRFSARNNREIRRIIQRPHGLILAVGPTGSGKTTTIHSMLQEINTERRKIWTAEDPVEISHPGLRQVQTNAAIGFTFAAAMRSFLRADPDVIMVGEMRDLETARMAVEAALTGHLVFSTLHTNSAPETITRLVDMGIDPFTFSDALLGVLAQRLVRKICQDCKEQYDGRAELDALEENLGTQNFRPDLAGKVVPLWRGNGCDKCGGTGHRGRMAVHELLVSNDAIAELIQKKATAAPLRRAALEAGMTTLLEDGFDKCLLGLTSLQQVLAVSSR